jgi:hypothetical protein
VLQALCLRLGVAPLEATEQNDRFEEPPGPNFENANEAKVTGYYSTLSLNPPFWGEAVLMMMELLVPRRHATPLKGSRFAPILANPPKYPTRSRRGLARLRASVVGQGDCQWHH